MGFCARCGEVVRNESKCVCGGLSKSRRVPKRRLNLGGVDGRADRTDQFQLPLARECSLSMAAEARQITIDGAAST